MKKIIFTLAILFSLAVPTDIVARQPGQWGENKRTVVSSSRNNCSGVNHTGPVLRLIRILVRR